MPTIYEIADAIILSHRDVFQDSPSNMKLQKLCYYAQGNFMASEDEPLFEEDFQAWVLGPVCKPLYDRFCSYKWKSISEEINVPVLSEKIMELLEEVVQAYGRFDAGVLSAMTHRESPWKEARKGKDDAELSAEIISKDSIKKYFKEINYSR